MIAAYIVGAIIALITCVIPFAYWVKTSMNPVNHPPPKLDDPS